MNLRYFMYFSYTQTSMLVHVAAGWVAATLNSVFLSNTYTSSNESMLFLVFVTYDLGGLVHVFSALGSIASMCSCWILLFLTNLY